MENWVGVGNNTDGPTRAPGSWLERRQGRGRAKGHGTLSEASSTSAPAHQFFKSTTSLANTPVCSHMPWLQKSGCLGEEEGGALKVLEEWKEQPSSASD